MQRIGVVLVAALATATAAGVEETLASCFRRTTRRSVDNYPPIAEYTRITAVKCMGECITAAGNINLLPCRSFTFDRLSHRCRLFDHDGSVAPSVVFPANDVDLYHRISTVGACGGLITTHPHLPYQIRNRANFKKLNEFGGMPGIRYPTRAPEEQAAVVTQEESLEESPRAGNEIQNEIVNEQSSDDNDQFSPFGGPDERTNHAGEVHKKASRSVATLDSAILSPSEVQVPKSRSHLVPHEGEQEKKPRGRKAASGEQCDNGVGYYVVIGNQIIAPSTHRSSVKSFTDVDQGDCARLCTLNKTPNGESVLCKSINYYPSKKRCEMFSILSEPHGPGNLLENRNSIYAEKFCLSPAARDCESEEVFVLHVQTKLASDPFDILKGTSITACLDKCFSKKMCRSVVFDSSHSQCRLHAESPADRGRKIVPTTPGVVLIENGCRRNVKPPPQKKKQPQSHRHANNPDIRRAPELRMVKLEKRQQVDEWSEWSSCQFKSSGKRFRVRSRDCSDGRYSCSNGGLELAPC